MHTAAQLVFCLALIEFSYTPIFGQYVYQTQVAMIFIKMILSEVLEAFTKDTLLIAPLDCAVSMTEMFISLGADSFIDFIISFFLGLAIDVCERLYIDPLVRKLEAVVPRYVAKLTERVRPGQVLVQQEKTKEQEKEESVVENILDDVKGYSADFLAILVTPVVIVVMMVYRTELEISALYGIRDTDLIFYQTFQVLILLSTVVVQVFIHQIQGMIELT